MPELPEVETIRRGLRVFTGAKVTACGASHARLRGGPAATTIVGRTLGAPGRHGKFILWPLDDGTRLVVHLGMSGKLLFARPGAPRRPHTHWWLRAGDKELRFVDPRRFGSVLHVADDPVAHLGIDALDPAFTPAHLGALLATSRAPLKGFLLDQGKVAGIGNIYACEALWRAGLSPRRRACNVGSSKVPVLHQAIVDVLGASLAAGGTSFNDYVDAIGRQGSFLFEVGVFQREGEPCARCSAAVRRLVQSGRSTFYCPTCQR